MRDSKQGEQPYGGTSFPLKRGRVSSSWRRTRTQ